MMQEHCIMCNKDFANKASLYGHLRSHHQQTPSNKNVKSQDTLQDSTVNESSEYLEDQHIFKKLSDIHDMLKNYLDSTKVSFNFVTCHYVKSVFDGLVPDVFESEIVMKDILTEQQYVYINIIRGLSNIFEIHVVLNEDASQDILSDIFVIINNRTFT